ncbi:MAG: FGGY family carbohydrate kinase, partial [Bacteroidota bacterium]|nr:FGGY family carbohydrate kinase [Bacteroidota bacterium]
MQYVIGIDIGTTSTKAVAFTDAGEILATCHSGYSAFSDKAGWHELDPIVLFDATTRVLKQAVQGAGKEGLVGVCFSCAMHSLIAVDHTGEPITPAMTWADLRSQKVAQALKGNPLTVYGDGQQSRCFLHVRDAVEGLIALAECSEAVGGVFNIGSQEEVTIFDLACKVLAMVDNFKGEVRGA